MRYTKPFTQYLKELDLKEARLAYEFELRTDYGNDGGPHSFSGSINASSKQDAGKQVAAIISKKIKEIADYGSEIYIKFNLKEESKKFFTRLYH